MIQVTRTVVTTTIHATKILFKDGKLVEEKVADVIVTNKKVAEDKALSYVVKQHGKNSQYIVTGMDKLEQVYSISFEDFMKHAKPIERPESQQKKED